MGKAYTRMTKSLYQPAPISRYCPKNSTFSHSAKLKIWTLSKAPVLVWTYCQHTHKRSKNSQGWICHGTTSIPVYRAKFTVDLTESNMAVSTFNKNIIHPHWSKSSFVKVQLTPFKSIHAFSHSSIDQGTTTQTYSLSLFLEWSQVTHIPQHNNGGPKSPKSHLSVVLLPDNCVTTTVFQDGS